MFLGEICVAVFFVLLGYFVWAGKTKKHFLEKAEGISSWHKIFYVGVMLPLTALRRHFGWRIKGDRLEQMKKIYIGKGEEEIFCLYYGKMACLVSGALMFCLVAIMMSGLITQEGKLIDGYFLKRDGVSGQEKTVNLSANIDRDEKEVAIQVPRKRYTKKQLSRKMKEAKDYVEHQYLGENSSAEEITKPLNLVKEIPRSAIEVSWKLDVDGVIKEDGTITNENLEEECFTEIIAVFSYEEYEESETKMLTVMPHQKTEEELYWEDWQRQVEENEKESATDSYLKLPDNVVGKKVNYEEKKISIPHMVLGASLFVLVMMIVLQEERMRKEIQYREKELRIDYPEFVEYFVLFVGAGLTVRGAWERIAQDYEEKGKEKRYVYEEMLVSVREMENGMGEARAYELFGKRTGLLQYMKFCTLIVQNLKKGSDDLLNLLDYEVADAFRERKENAKTLGEEAGTKLLLPMMLMLMVVFALILYAAFYNL